ncbi:MAG TPA: helix-turn-helix domain-containing protein [bacterium]|nr:helix-turn-helix domain-containing protein [bacterium]
MSEWLTLGEAARLLGVDETTLRGWADAGKVRVYRTPGGHRRFNASDLAGLLSSPEPPPAGADALRDSLLPSERGESAREWMTSRPWFAGIDAEARGRARAQCGKLMEALATYLEADDASRGGQMSSARLIGSELGREVARWGLTPAQSTDVFLHFKRGVTEMLAASRRGGSGQIRSMRDADAFLGDALQAMMEAYEERRPA